MSHAHISLIVDLKVLSKFEGCKEEASKVPPNFSKQAPINDKLMSSCSHRRIEYKE